MRSLCRLPVAKNSNFGQMLAFWGLLYRPPFTDEGQIWCAIAHPRSTSTCEISSRFILSSCGGEKKTIFAVFWTSAFSVVANWQQSDKAEQGCTNLPLSNSIKIVSVLQCLHCKIGRTNSDVQKHDGQRDKHTQYFWPPRRRMKSEPHQTLHGYRGPRARSCTSKTFGGLTHSFAARGR